VDVGTPLKTRSPRCYYIIAAGGGWRLSATVAALVERMFLWEYPVERQTHLPTLGLPDHTSTVRWSWRARRGGWCRWCTGLPMIFAGWDWVWGETVDRADRQAVPLLAYGLRYGWDSRVATVGKFTAEIETEDRVISLDRHHPRHCSECGTAYINFGSTTSWCNFELLDIIVVSPVSRAGSQPLHLLANHLIRLTPRSDECHLRANDLLYTRSTTVVLDGEITRPHRWMCAWRTTIFAPLNAAPPSQLKTGRTAPVTGAQANWWGWGRKLNVSLSLQPTPEQSRHDCGNRLSNTWLDHTRKQIRPIIISNYYFQISSTSVSLIEFVIGCNSSS